MHLNIKQNYDIIFLGWCSKRKCGVWLRLFEHEVGEVSLRGFKGLMRGKRCDPSISRIVLRKRCPWCNVISEGTSACSGHAASHLIFFTLYTLILPLSAHIPPPFPSLKLWSRIPHLDSMKYKCALLPYILFLSYITSIFLWYSYWSHFTLLELLHLCVHFFWVSKYDLSLLKNFSPQEHSAKWTGHKTPILLNWFVFLFFLPKLNYDPQTFISDHGLSGLRWIRPELNFGIIRVQAENCIH